MTNFWETGDVNRLATLTKIAPETVSRILNRKTGVSKLNSMRLETASAKLGKHVPFDIWLFSETVDHPAFAGKPRKEIMKKYIAAKSLK